MTDLDADRNREIVERLRTRFAATEALLTPEIEVAGVYWLPPHPNATDAEEELDS
mgnify:CR=1 FL=1